MYAVTRPARVAGVIALAFSIAFTVPAAAAERSAAKTAAAHAARAAAKPAAAAPAVAAKHTRSASTATTNRTRSTSATTTKHRAGTAKRSRASSRPASHKASATRSSAHRASRSAARRPSGGGSASWYGPGFHGKRTASGQQFNQDALTAAHRSLPFGTKVKVTNRSNGKSVVVTINDRGPFHGGRVIDLSRGAASKLGMMASGTARVLLEVQGRG